MTTGAPAPLPRLEALTSTVRTVFINIGFFIAILLLIPAVAGQLASNAIVIDPLTVPTTLSDRGITPEVAANRLWDGLQAVSRDASLARATLVAVPNSRLARFSLPDTGISIDSVFRHLRQFFGAYETHIAGEIVCDTADCAPSSLRLRLRVIRGDSQIVDLPPIGERSEQDYFKDAAAGVFDILDPFVAIAARAVTDPASAALHARQLALAGHTDAKWAHNLLGDIARKAGDPASAIEDYRAALVLDDTFNIARLGLARALAEQGDFPAAEQAIADAQSREPAMLALPGAKADVLVAKGDKAGAVAEFLLAAERNPLDPAPLVRAGALQLELGETDKGIAHLEEALDLDPGEAQALGLLGNAYRDDGDLAAAERLFKDWADYAPDSVEAQLAIGRVLVERDDRDAAAPYFERAIALAPDNSGYAIERARLLFGLARYAQAIDGLKPFADGDQPNADAILLLAQIEQMAGRHERAVTRYRQYLEVLPHAPDKADIEAIIRRLGG